MSKEPTEPTEPARHTGPPPDPGVPGRRALYAGLAGAALILAYLALYAADPLLRRVQFVFVTIPSSGEAALYTGHAFLLFPGACLLGYALSGVLGPRLVDLARRLGEDPRRSATFAALGLFAVAVLCARLGRLLFLLDLPVTDDEGAVRFGGEVLASGRLWAQLGPLIDYVQNRFLFVGPDGKATSLDWLGGQLLWALGTLLGQPDLLFALVAALPVLALVRFLSARLSPAYGLLGGALFLASPMAFALSLTSHEHLGSRAFLALFLWLLCDAEDAAQPGAPPRRADLLGVAAGLALGAAALCRALEVIFFVIPLFLGLAADARRREPGAARRLVCVLLGAALPLLLLLWHNAQMTSNPLLPPRLSSKGMVADTWRKLTFAERIGKNVGYNTWMLALWFLGPLGILLVIAGADADRWTRRLTLGVGSALALALFHDASGIHVVGPIHYSECAVPLAIVATYGLRRLVSLAAALRLAPGVIIVPVLAALALGLGLDDGLYARQLRDQAQLQARYLDTLDAEVRRHGPTPAVVLAPRMVSLWSKTPAWEIGTHVLDWPKPHPDLSDPILILQDKPGAAETARQLLRGRPIYRLEPAPGALFTLRPL